MALAVNLKAHRLNRGMSLAEAAKHIGVPKNVLLAAESGSVTPQPRNAFKIASFYGYRVTDIWPVDEPTEAAA